MKVIDYNIVLCMQRSKWQREEIFIRNKDLKHLLVYIVLTYLYVMHLQFLTISNNFHLNIKEACGLSI